VSDNGMYINVFDTISNSLGSFNWNVAVRLSDNTCATVVSSGNRQISIPVGYMQYGGIDYIVAITTGLEAGTCVGVFGKYFLYKSDYGTLARSTIPAIPVNNGVVAFVNPTTLGLGLPAFSGYAKTVEVSITSIGGVPKVLAMVYYEDV